MGEPEVNLPDALKSMIQQSVEDDVNSENVVAEKPLSESVKASQLLLFFDSAQTEVRNADLLNLRSKINGLCKEANATERMQYVRKEIETIYDNTWKQIGVSIELGQRAVTGVQALLHDQKIDISFRQKIQASLVMFKQAESELVGRLLFGDKAFEARKKQQLSVLARKNVLEKEFVELTKEEKGKRVKDLKTKAFALRQKLMNMGGAGAAKYLKDLKDEEEKVMLDLSALALMIQEGSQVLPQGIGPPQGIQTTQKQGCKKCSHHKH